MFIRKIFYMSQVIRNQWLSAEEIKHLQFGKLKKIIKHAYFNTKFYNRKLSDAGLHPKDIKCTEDLMKIPMTTKRELLDNYSSGIISRNHKLSECHIENTSGSGGLKLNVALDYKGKDFCDCVYGRALFAIGYKPWQPMAYFWPDTKHKKEFHEYFGLMPKNWISSHIKAEEQLDILMGLRPEIIYSFPTTLTVLAKMIESDRTRYGPIRPRFIVSHAELLAGETRRYLESVFDCPVYNEYGATEFGFRMAWECTERRGMHLDADSIFVEFLDGNFLPVPPGQSKEMVVTGLVNEAMPLIRYRIGDTGIPSERKCPCGRGLPLVESIEGRKDDYIRLPSGKLISPRALVPLVEQFRDILEFRIIQHKEDLFRVYIVNPRGIGTQTISELKSSLSDMMNEEVEISVETVSELPRNERGKLKSVISEVNNS
jgi:phenylacetate-CoA ligase